MYTFKGNNSDIGLPLSSFYNRFNTSEVNHPALPIANWRKTFRCIIVLKCDNFITKTHLFKYTENFISKNWKFSDKNFDIFQISVQNIDCGYSLEPPRRGGSNEYPQSMFLSWNKKNNVYPCKPQFYYIKVGFKGVNII